MAMKNIAAFGIYPDQGTVNDAIESLKAAASVRPISRFCFRRTSARKTLLTRNTPKRRKALWLAVDRAQSSAPLLVGWLAQARCSFRDWRRCTLPVRYSGCWAA